MPVHDGLDDVEPQATPRPDVLGREEGLEDPGADVLWNPGPRVAHLDADARSDGRPGPRQSLGVGLRITPDGDLEHATSAHRVRRIDDQVRPDLVELAAEGFDARPSGRVRAADLDPCLQAWAQHHERALDT